MTDVIDHAVLDVRQLRPKLRRDIRIMEQVFRGESSFIIQDPITCQFHRLGPSEYRFVRELDGNTSVAQILEEQAEDLGEDSLSPDLAARLLNYLQQSNLLETHEHLDPTSLYEAYRKLRRKRGLQIAGNFLFINLPLVDPDGFLRRTLPVVRPLLGRGFFFLWLASVATAFWIVVTHWTELLSRANGVLAPRNLLLLYVSFAFLKLFHEMWHGYVCRRYGGPVHEMGILFLIFTPFFYCEASSAWGFDSKWKKIYVSAAGMYIELFLASMAAMVWFATNPGVVHTLAYNVVFVASVSTVLFNGNPLLRYDGYYILADLLEVPNLWTNSNGYLRYLMTRYLLGHKQESPVDSLREAAMLTGYGIASFLYRIAVCIGIIVFVSRQLKGLGILLAIGAVVAWVFVPVGKALNYMFLTAGTRAQRRRAGGVTMGLAVVAVILLGVVSLPMRLYTTAAVDYRDVQIVRADAPGFVAELCVTTGQRVAPGQVLVRLANEPLLAEYKKAKADVDLVRQQFASLEVTDVAAAQAIKPRIAARQTRLDDLSKKVESLTLRAAIDGVVITGRIDELVGRYKDTGEEILTVADTEHPLLKAAIDQEDVYEYRHAVGERVEVRLRANPSQVIVGRIEKIAPRSTRQIPHPALTAKAGEDLLLDPAVDSNEPQLLTPVFVAEIAPADPAVRLPGGSVARVRFEAADRPLAAQWYRKVVRLVRSLWL
jgi:putative peptide zinc metalloprotease protein